jgi:hypothetical protein
MNAILDERPAQLEVHGAELLAVSDELRRRGCIVLGMAVTCVSSYRLSLSWPQPKQQPLLENEHLRDHENVHLVRVRKELKQQINATKSNNSMTKQQP